MVWYKRKTVVVPMVVVALVFCIAVPMAVTSNKRESVSLSPSTPQDEDKVGEHEEPAADRDVVNFDDSQTNGNDVTFDDSDTSTGSAPAPSTTFTETGSEATTLPLENSSPHTNDPSTYEPSALPSDAPSTVPSDVPSTVPSTSPSNEPTALLLSDRDGSDIFSATQTTSVPSAVPSAVPSDLPSDAPSTVPSDVPSTVPSTSPSNEPTTLLLSDRDGSDIFSATQTTSVPSAVPSAVPSDLPTAVPSTSPSNSPSVLPSEVPSSEPSVLPSEAPSSKPSALPSDAPSDKPSNSPSDIPSVFPSATPFRLMIPDAYLGASDYPSIIPTVRRTPEPTTKVQRFLKYGDTKAPTPVPSLERAHMGSDFPSIVPRHWDTPAPTKPEQRMDASPAIEQERRRQARKL